MEITPEAQQRSGIVVTAAASTPMTQHLQVTGTVQPIDSSIAHIRPLARGRLLEVLVKVGDRVDCRPGARATRQHRGWRNYPPSTIPLGPNSRDSKSNLRRSSAKLSETAVWQRLALFPRKTMSSVWQSSRAWKKAFALRKSTIAGLTARLRRFGISEPKEMRLRLRLSGRRLPE